MNCYGEDRCFVSDGDVLKPVNVGEIPVTRNARELLVQS
jgi:hypothetical protein